jgi:hypothetical protein
MKSNNGIVAFLDILGYQNFIDRNDVSVAVAILNDAFANLKELVAEDFKTNWTKVTNNAGLFFDKLIIQTLSDSIILHLPVEDDDPTALAFSWATILQCVRVLQRRLFDRGFPSRGAISVGEYYFAEGFLVGKPFMEAYRLSQSLDLAATALTPAAYTQANDAYSKIYKGLSHYKGGAFYLTPLKGKEESYFLLSPLRPEETASLLQKDLAQWVHQVFWMHEKEAGISVDLKIANTVKFFRFCIIKHGKQ